MRRLIYDFLVNRKPGISFRYHSVHDGAVGAWRILSWLYLLWLNLAYYVFFCRFLGKLPAAGYYESKQAKPGISESIEYDANELYEKLLAYDVVSFDIFDTLLFRPFSDPTDVFYLIGEDLGILDFKNLRIRAEREARADMLQISGHTEVSLRDIWDKLSESIGIDVAMGSALEERVEYSLCYANPFMLDIFLRLREAGKQIIMVSDMYLSGKAIGAMLKKAGYIVDYKIYVSNEYRAGKSDGKLYEAVEKDFPNMRIAHVGDNPVSDIKNAKRCGVAAFLYPKTDKDMSKLRPYDMSAIVGSAYRGIVSNRLYCGKTEFSGAYEYGYIYGGLFVLGYLGFIREYAETHDIDRIIFLSRDGDILKKIYDILYPENNSVYAYWSRRAAAKLMAAHNKVDYFKRFVYHKIGQGYKVSDIFSGMELEPLLCEWQGGQDVHMTEKEASDIVSFISARWDKVEAIYAEQATATKEYYAGVISGCKKAAVVDIGWAGSGAMSLSYLAANDWNIDCEMIGIIAGTNTVSNSEPDASEPFLQDGKLVSYMFSQRHNRDLLKKHDPGRGYNLFWELILSSPTPQFIGFYADGPHFGKKDVDEEISQEIQNGITDFAVEYKEYFKDYPFMYNVSGRDAYAPLLSVTGHKERYLKAFAKSSGIEMNVS